MGVMAALTRTVARRRLVIAAAATALLAGHMERGWASCGVVEGVWTSGWWDVMAGFVECMDVVWRGTEHIDAGRAAEGADERVLRRDGGGGVSGGAVGNRCAAVTRRRRR